MSSTTRASVGLAARRLHWLVVLAAVGYLVWQAPVLAPSLVDGRAQLVQHTPEPGPVPAASR
jgi:hypothetical protein